MLSKGMAGALRSACAAWQFAADKPWSPDICATAKHIWVLVGDPDVNELSW